MASEHDDLVLEVAARNLCHGVVNHRIIIVELGLQLYGHLELFALLDHADQAVEVLRREGDLGITFGGSLLQTGFRLSRGVSGG